MTQDEILKIANDMAFMASIWIEDDSNEFKDMIKFAKLVADKEREACAKVIEKSRVIEMVVFPKDYLISRNDVQKCYDHQHKRCVEAIRARSISRGEH